MTTISESQRLAAFVRGQKNGRMGVTSMVAGRAQINETASAARHGQRDPNGRELPRVEMPAKS